MPQRPDMLQGGGSEEVTEEMRPESQRDPRAVAQALLVAALAVELQHLVAESFAKRRGIQVEERSKEALSPCRTAAHAGRSCLRRAIATTLASRESSRPSTRRPKGVTR